MCGVIKQPTADLNLKTEHNGTIELNEDGTATVFIFQNFPDMIYLNKTYHPSSTNNPTNDSNKSEHNTTGISSSLSPSPRETINSHYNIPTFQVIYQITALGQSMPNLYVKREVTRYKHHSAANKPNKTYSSIVPGFLTKKSTSNQDKTVSNTTTAAGSSTLSSSTNTSTNTTTATNTAPSSSSGKKDKTTIIDTKSNVLLTPPSTSRNASRSTSPDEKWWIDRAQGSEDNLNLSASNKKGLNRSVSTGDLSKTSSVNIPLSKSHDQLLYLQHNDRLIDGPLPLEILRETYLRQFGGGSVVGKKTSSNGIISGGAAGQKDATTNTTPDKNSKSPLLKTIPEHDSTNTSNVSTSHSTSETITTTSLESSHSQQHSSSSSSSHHEPLCYFTIAGGVAGARVSWSIKTIPVKPRTRSHTAGITMLQGDWRSIN